VGDRERRLQAAEPQPSRDGDRKIPNRGHSLTIDHGWREVAQTALDFVKRFVPAKLPLMNKPRIFLGSSGEQAKLLRAIERGLSEIADVEPWTTTFNPGRSTLDRLVELSREVDFAAFVFAQDD
jgi:hypothetical protein